MSDASLAPQPLLPPRRPTVRFMLSHPAHLVALGFGSGLAPVAPGTFGTLWAWLTFAALQHWLQPGEVGELIALSLVLGWWACTVTARHLRIADPSAIVWDEIVCFWLVLWVVTPEGWADGRFKGQGWRGGFGILVDDLVAAFCTLLVLALWRTWG